MEERGRLVIEVWSRSDGGGTQAKQQRELVSINQDMEDILIGVGSVSVNILLQVRKAHIVALHGLHFKNIPLVHIRFGGCTYTSLVVKFNS